MAKQTILTEIGTGEVMYPQTLARLVKTADGGNVDEGLEQAKRAVFNDMWDAAWGGYGKYDPANAPDPQHPYMGNEIWMTYEEALEVMKAGYINSYYPNGAYRNHNVRTNLPSRDFGIYQEGLAVFYYNSIEVADLGPSVFPGSLCFANCANLRVINPRGYLLINKDVTTAFQNSKKLESVKMRIIGNFNVNIADSPLLSLASLKYLVDNAANTSTITVTLHADVYAKLTDGADPSWGELLTKALSKNITIACA